MIIISTRQTSKIQTFAFNKLILIILRFMFSVPNRLLFEKQCKRSIVYLWERIYII